MKAVVLLNKGAGTIAKGKGGEPTDLCRLFAESGAQAQVREIEPWELDETTRQAIASDADVVIAGGGDGTINSIANLVAGSDKTFGVLPLGTHNHFAKDLKIPLDLNEAIAALARGKVEELPVAEVNGRIFLNFSAIGIHPEIVKHRDAQRETLGRSKWAAMVVSTWRMLWRFPVQHVTIRARGHTFARRAVSVIVCNNPHQMKVFGVDDASVPDRGLLNVYVAAPRRRSGLVRMMLRITIGRVEKAERFESMALPELKIETHRRHTRVSVDGEVIDMISPLHYRIRPKPMRVLMPEPAMELTPNKVESS